MGQKEFQEHLDALKSERSKTKDKLVALKGMLAKAQESLASIKRNIETLVDMRSNLRAGSEVVSLDEFRKAGILLRTNRDQMVEKGHEIVKLNKQIHDVTATGAALVAQIQGVETELGSYGQVLEFPKKIESVSVSA
jgi:predicted  nucleic acid-binding Zn-ribbon protein